MEESKDPQFKYLIPKKSIDIPRSLVNQICRISTASATQS